MKRIQLLFASACLVALSAILIMGCKNNKTDTTALDTAVITPSLSQLPDTMRKAAKDSLIKKEDSISISGNTNKETGSEVRLKKVSRKGRVILELLKTATPEKIESDKEGIYNRAEVMPSYPGGEKALRKFIETTIHYPENDIDDNIQGTVKVYFAVDEQGKVYTPTIISQKLGYGLEEEALRVIRQMPTWVPGQIKGKNVKTHFTLPITYRID